MTSTPATAGTIAGSVLPIRRAEELIQTLPGVLSVRIVPNETGAIDEIHVLTTDQVLPKHTVRNIESALMAQLGLRVNHRKVSIATTLDAPRAADVSSVGPQTVMSGLAAVPGGAAPVVPPSVSAAAGALGSASEAAMAVAVEGRLSAGSTEGRSAPEREARESALNRTESSTPVVSRPGTELGRRLLIFEDVEVRRSRARGVTCLVTLSREGQTYVGEADGQETERSRIELAARATVQAIAASRGSPGGERGLGLEGATLIEAFDREFVFVSIAVRIGREPVVLTGSCEVRETAETSAVLAVLDATNRWLYLDR